MFRSDAELMSEVKAELWADPELDATDVRVRVEAGVVWLSGSIRSLHELVAAGRAAWRVCGVEAVANGLRVDRPVPRRASRR